MNGWHSLRIGASERRIGPFTLWAVWEERSPPGVVRYTWSIAGERGATLHLFDMGNVDRPASMDTATLTAEHAAQAAAEDALRTRLIAWLAELSHDAFTPAP